MLKEKLKSLPFNSELTSLGCQIFAVGGAVRDSFLGKESKDLDVIICGIPLEKLILILQSYGKVNEVGKSFGVIKFTPKEETGEIDIAIPRTEKKIGVGYKGFETLSGHNLPIEDDLFRRDFTLNSMAMGLDGKIIDPFGGLDDIKSKKIRLTNPLAFSDDPLRMLRAIQFSSRFGFQIEEETMIKIRANAHKIKEITSERVLIEFEKILTKGDMKIGAKLLHQSNLFEYLFDNSVCEENMFDVENNIINKSKTMGEFLFLLTLGLVPQPFDFFTKNWKCETQTLKEIKGLTRAFKTSIFDTNCQKKKAIFETINICPSLLHSEILPHFLDSELEMFKSGKLPKSLKELAMDGNDLMTLGFKGKEIKEIQFFLLDLIFSNSIENNKKSFINAIDSMVI